MDKQVSVEVSRSFRSQDDLFAGLGAEALAAIATANSDVVLVLDRSGRILDAAFRDSDLHGWDVDAWVGRPWSDTVTVESRDKIADLLQESMRASPTRTRQVNHPAADGGRDLPVNYRLVSFEGWPNVVALGTDLRAMAEMQQRLVRAQIDMEKDYRKLRDIESRYRILFHLAVEPLIVVQGQTLRILDANDGAAKLLDKPLKKLIGMGAASVFAKSDQGAATESLVAMGARARQDSFHARPATLDTPMEIRVTPFREFGRTNLLVCFVTDEPERANVATTAETTLVSMIESLPEGIVVIDGEGRVVDANPAFLDLIRVVSLDRIENKGLDNWLGGSGVDLQVLLANLREHGSVRRFASVVRDELGGQESVEISAARIASREGPMFGFAIRETARQDNAQISSAAAGRPHSTMQFIDMVGRVPLKDLVRDTADVIEKLCIEAALRLTDNNRASAADMLGLSRQSLYIKLKRYGISDPEEQD
jgi:transcriptional regulator PpsR